MHQFDRGLLIDIFDSIFIQFFYLFKFLYQEKSSYFTKKFDSFFIYKNWFQEYVEPFIKKLQAKFERFKELFISIDELIDSIIPAMNPTPIDWIFADEKDLLIFRIEGAANDRIVVWFDVFIVLILQEPLVNDFFRHLPLIDQHITSTIVDP